MPKVGLALIAVATACGGAGTQNVEEARSAVYASSFEQVFKATYEAVNGEYKKSVADPANRMIKTPNHQLPLTEHVETREEDQRTSSPTGAGAGATSSGEDPNRFLARREDRREATDRTMRYFVRFEVTLEQVTEAPGAADARWTVAIEGFASRWDGTAQPEQLTGAETPYWLAKRVDKLQIAIYEKLRGMAVAPPPAATTPAP
jgi:hypothetical protein